jgi:hypothetical protein
VLLNGGQEGVRDFFSYFGLLKNQEINPIKTYFKNLTPYVTVSHVSAHDVIGASPEH